MSESAAALETGEAADPVMMALWGRALEAWEDDKVHLALLDHAMRTQTLPELAGRYRAVLDADGGAVEAGEAGDATDANDVRRAIAKKRLDAIVVAATHMLFAMKSPPREKLPRSLVMSTVGICATLLALVAYAVLRSR